MGINQERKTKDGEYQKKKISPERREAGKEEAGKEIDEILAFEMKLKRSNVKKADEEGRITWGCEECNWGNTEKEKVIGHIAQNHRWMTKGRIQCPYCPRTYDNMENMKTHLRKERCPNIARETQEDIWENIRTK